jgi:hypothetical protein
MTAHDHLDELAELYALGALDDAERASVDAQARTCAECAARLGEAESTIVQFVPEREPSRALDRRMRAAFAPPQRQSAWRIGPLVAAAFILGLLPGVLFGVLHRSAAPPFAADRERAINAMVTSHFLHAQFQPLTPDAPKAKVVYGRTTPWRFFIAQSSHAYTVAATQGRNVIILGKLNVSGDAAELFIPQTGARSFVLMDGNRVVAHVHLP